jgi:hypothetical protein
VDNLVWTISKALDKRKTPSIYQLGEFICNFPGTPRKIQVHAHIVGYKLAVGILPPSDTSILPSRTTVGITHYLSYKNGPEIIHFPRESTPGYLFRNLQTLGLTKTIKPK